MRIRREAHCVRNQMYFVELFTLPNSISIGQQRKLHEFSILNSQKLAKIPTGSPAYTIWVEEAPSDVILFLPSPVEADFE
jgi:hypothetical protein